MLERYTRPEMGKIWSDENKYEAWLKVEIAATNAWSELDEVPKADAAKIAQNASFTPERVAELEQITHHDVVAFTRTVSESLGPEKKWVHFGLTSTDVVDTAQGYILKQADAIIRQDLQDLKKTIAEKARKYKNTVEMGRTHGVQAEPTTFGLKLARWYAEIKRDIERFEHAAKGVESGKISGAVGTFANVPPAVETSVLRQLGLTQQPITSQVLPRDLHAEYIATLALIATSIENWATEIRSLQRSEIHEVEEHFRAGQKGSSAMPHKRNPIGSENLCGMARVLRGHIITAYEDVSLWHERDISHSSAERVILPDTTIGIDYMLDRFNRILTNLDVFPETMLKNMDKTYGLIYSQRLLLKLIDEAGLSREDAYDMVQKLTNKSWNEGISFRKLVEDSRIMNYLSEDDVADAFDYHYHLRHVDEIFKKVGLE
ncbi:MULTISPECIES: adenylosuccinate lyase [unclassified Lactobacillus]|uniref:adenylosuccinate lyase n=1 Tax=unclassified Lactobacillus TaxID=2620435 RepID=UPI0018DC9FFE|nr:MULTISPECIES: adenylosuccinate lyase [unclassified Lactobacillus]MBH9990083.1 adenylosuccinate lyase [Lactobacillus sp. M0392]MBI0024586.1 adenylosuccinate lyase [Lactobacillus sp. W8171]MBI0045229.1 adenylosuccinate lyase [Lactobacillus sp. M0393]